MRDCYRIVYKTYYSDEPFIATCWFISREKLLEVYGRETVKECLEANEISKEEYSIEDIFEDLYRDGSVTISWGIWIEIESDKICLEESK
ncbi:MAG: hypothetical protein SPH83_02385 [Treponema sp.]|nr:hypothetical protein [Spirochaetales bacterium]MDY6189327.1 hypothetical protein [Treponema sp.]